jgi:hypothetical protein
MNLAPLDSSRQRASFKIKIFAKLAKKYFFNVRKFLAHDWVQLIRKYAAPAENQSVLVELDYPLFRLISDPKHLRQCTSLSERRHPERGNQVASLRRRFLLESLRYKLTSHLSPEPRLVRVCTQTVPVVTQVIF